jgi:hypothetical protein
MKLSRQIWFGLALPLSCAFAQAPPVHPLFERDEVHEIRLTFAQQDWYEQLTANYAENEDDVPYIEASFEWRSTRFEKVGIRFKGNSSYRGATTQKKPFRIKLNEYTKGQKISGIASLNLSNGWNDPSMVREKIYFEMAAQLGIVAPRSNYAALYINGQYWGLYFLGEVVNSDFLESRWPQDKNGNLYKSNIGASLEDLGDDKESYRALYEKKTNEDADDFSDLIGLVAAINRSSSEEFLEKVSERIDIDSVLVALALDNATVNLDSYVGMAQNYYIYRRADNKFVWIPWDPSLAFGALSQGVSAEQMKTLSLEWTTTQGAGFPGGGIVVLPPGGGFPPGGGVPPPGGGFVGGPGGGSRSNARPLATKLWAIPSVKARYTELYRQLSDFAFLPESMVTRMNEIRSLIRPWMEQDTQKLSTMEQFENAMSQDTQFGGGAPGGGFGGPGGQVLVPAGAGIPALEPFVRDRAVSIQQQLAERP